MGELQISCTTNQSGSVEVAESREDHRSAAPAEDFKDMDPAAMQLQMLVMAKQMEMLSRELERMQRKTSPDNKRMRSEVGSGNSGQREGDDNQVWSHLLISIVLALRMKVIMQINLRTVWPNLISS